MLRGIGHALDPTTYTRAEDAGRQSEASRKQLMSMWLICMAYCAVFILTPSSADPPPLKGTVAAAASTEELTTSEANVLAVARLIDLIERCLAISGAGMSTIWIGFASTMSPVEFGRFIERMGILIHGPPGFGIAITFIKIANLLLVYIASASQSSTLSSPVMIFFFASISVAACIGACIISCMFCCFFYEKYQSSRQQHDISNAGELDPLV